MDFALTETQRMIQETAREFAAKEVAPLAEKIDREAYFPKELVRRMAELGLLGICVPEEWGGAGLDTVSYLLAMEEISAACATTGVILSAQNSLVCDPLVRWGTGAQKEKWLRPLAKGERLGCFCLSEPNTGSDAGAQKTRAERKGDRYVLSGTKNWITNGPYADTAIVFAMSAPGEGIHGITAFIIDAKQTPGFKPGRLEDKLGICGSATCQITLEDCEVPADQVLGKEGEGFKVAMSTLDGGRIGIAAQALGIARAAFEAARRYATERKAFGRVIAEHEAIGFYLADMALRIEAGSLLAYKAAFLKQSGQKYGTEAAMAKLYCSEAASWIATKAIQIHGGNGFSKEFPVERHFRDARVTEIYEGTSEIQRVVISRAVLGK